MRNTRRLLTILNLIGHLLLPVLTIREHIRPLMPYLRPLYANRREIRQFLTEMRQINAVLQHQQVGYPQESKVNGS